MRFRRYGAGAQTSSPRILMLITNEAIRAKDFTYDFIPGGRS